MYMGAMATKQALFGAGCFWGVQAAFDELQGVSRTTVGYSGGRTEHPSYEDVCTDETGHAEVVLVEYDPSKIAYEELLATFFANHDPTQVNRQGPDVGTQYRSAIFTYDEQQRAAAAQAKRALAEKIGKPVATVIEPAQAFYEAEAYHQKYLEKRGAKSCRI